MLLVLRCRLWYVVYAVIFLLTTWCAMETLVSADTLACHVLAIGVSVMSMVAIYQILVVVGPMEQCWFRVETDP